MEHYEIYIDGIFYCSCDNQSDLQTEIVKLEQTKEENNYDVQM